MRYEHIREAVFVDRPNRFIANVLLEGVPTRCHVKNTGRCRELLVSGARIFVNLAATPGRTTGCDLIAVYKGDRLINMDAAAPNQVFGEWLRSGGMGEIPRLVQPEKTYGSSRFDFYTELAAGPCYIEVKGVTLEQAGVARFPDAPTERGVKHLRELSSLARSGVRAMAVFVVQMEDVRWFEPNRETHPAFADALAEAAAAGVELRCFDCAVTPDSLTLRRPVELRLRG